MIIASASMLGDYIDCKRKAYYRINKIRVPPTASMIVGRVIHDMVVDLEKGRDRSWRRKQLTVELTQTKAKFARGQTIPNLLNLVDTCLANYKKLRIDLPGIWELEESFSLTGDGVKIVGRFDQLRKGDTIVELKTGKWEPTKEFLEADLQTTLYMWAYRELFDVMPIYYYIHLSSGSLYQQYRNDFTNLLDLIDDFMTDCNRDALRKQLNGYRCGRCDFNKHCLDGKNTSKLITTASPQIPAYKPPSVRGKFFE